MGIPSYFSYIVKNHINIIRKLGKKSMIINNLYMDCNSIIYDAVRTIDFANFKVGEYTDAIIRQVTVKIEEYIGLIGPDNLIYIAFDGVAPVAKLEQQRSRRYKSWYQSEITKSIFATATATITSNKVTSWNTTAITPGTEFMVELNRRIHDYFSDTPANLEKYNVHKIIVSSSDEVGEGEHKIFEYIRLLPGLVSTELSTELSNEQNKTSVIYGLDADLIMLSINHLPINKNIFLFRETPEFIKSIDNSLEPNETYLMDIPLLAEIITLDMNNGVELTTVQQKNRIYDYIFLCFFLGNDFMPHFPALNIRTGGVDKMLGAYKATIGLSANENLTDGKQIFWKNVRKLVAFLANMEEEYFKNEAKLRDKRERYTLPEETAEQKYMKFEAIPTYERETEKYINPYKVGWQSRYYKSLMNVDRDEIWCKQISLNYLQGLEWTMKYYTSGCPDWRWKYNYNYPPLLQDLLTYIPYFDTVYIKDNGAVAVSPYTQLSYVLPRQSLHFLPEKIYRRLKEDYSHWYPTDCEFVWAYSRYFWESHVELPELDIDEIETVVLNI